VFVTRKSWSRRLSQVRRAIPEGCHQGFLEGNPGWFFLLTIVSLILCQSDREHKGGWLCSRAEGARCLGPAPAAHHAIPQTQHRDPVPQKGALLLLLLLLLLLFLSSMRRERRASLTYHLGGQVLAGHFSVELITHAVAGHGQALRDCFTAILGLEDYLLRAPEPALRRYGVLFYTLSFRHFPDTYHRQEVLGNLVVHVGSGSPHEIDRTLDVLEFLAQHDPAHLAAHASFIQVSAFIAASALFLSL